MSKRPKTELKKYAVKKFVFASSVKEALRLEKSAVIDEVWVDEEWKRSNPNVGSRGKMGFQTTNAVSADIEKDEPL